MNLLLEEEEKKRMFWDEMPLQKDVKHSNAESGVMKRGQSTTKNGTTEIEEESYFTTAEGGNTFWLGLVRSY